MLCYNGGINMTAYWLNFKKKRARRWGACRAAHRASLPPEEAAKLHKKASRELIKFSDFHQNIAFAVKV